MSLAKDLIDWYDVNRRHMAWREEPTPYHVYLSEIMLQQTQVDTVRAYYDRFLKAFPTINDLANASEEQVLKLWEGLGYYSRGRNLHKAALQIVSQYGGNIPDNSAELLSLPGIGAYTSRAILAIAFHHKEIAVDGNLVRVYSRLQEDGEANPETLKTSAEAFFKAQLSDVDPSSYNQALMDLGELVCLPKGDPLCSVCPLAAYCKAKANASYLAYPPSKKPLQKKQEERTIFLLVYQGNVALQKRPDVGLLASLYEFPNEVGNYSLAAVKKLAKDWGLDVKAITPLGQTTHTFSHLLWKLTGFRLDLKKQPQRAYIWSTKDQLLNDYSIPSAFAFYKEAYLKGKP